MKCIFFLLLSTSTAVFAQPIKPLALDKAIAEIISRSNVAGASVLIAEKGRIILNKGYGSAHLGFGVKTNADTKYYIVGPGTIILGAAIMQQIEKGNLSLDDDINKYLPHFPTHGKKITIRHLLSCTSGIPDYHYLGDPLSSKAYQPLHSDEIIDLFAGRPLVMEPGTDFDWSISNFSLLTAVLEAVTKTIYQDYLEEHFIKPLSLTNTQYFDAKKMIQNFAQGYNRAGSALSPATQSLEKYDPSYRLVSTTGDLFKMWQGMMNGKLITRTSFQLMTDSAEAAKNNAGDFRYALNTLKAPDYPYSIFMNGSLEGFTSTLAYFPDRDITIIVLSNTTGQYQLPITIMNKLYGLEEPSQPPVTFPAIVTSVTVPVAEAEKITGTYILNITERGDLTLKRTFKTAEWSIRIFSEHDQMMWQDKGELPVPLYKQPDGTFRLAHTPFGVISFDLSGTITSFKLNFSDGSIYNGKKVGDASVRTFHATRLQQLK